MEDNAKLKQQAEEEKEMRLHFEDKFSGIMRQLNDAKSKLKLSEEDLSKIHEDNKDLKTSTEMQNSSLTLLSQDKFKLEKLVANYQAEAGSLKEQIMSKQGMIGH